jgi:nucleoside-diphosphate-sugar epimerase
MNTMFGTDPSGGIDFDINKENIEICITGVSGFIGSHICVQLLQNGYKVRGTVRDPTDIDNYKFLLSNVEDYQDKLKIFKADLNNEEDWVKATKGCTHCIHVASPVPSRKAKKEEVHPPIVEGTKYVL